MQLIRDLRQVPALLTRSVVSIGNFDGGHRGHQALLAVLRQKAQRAHLPAVVLTFEPLPREFFAPDSSLPRLMSFREKYDFFKSQGIDAWCILKFDRSLAAVSAQDFVKDILCERLGMHAIVIGYDFRFGKGRGGDHALLREMANPMGFSVTQVPPHIEEGVVVSSTRVRAALQQGEMTKAAHLLGRYFSLTARVVHGDKRGRQLGYPTANLACVGRTLPLAGVFVVHVDINGTLYNGVGNVGVRPSIGTNVSTVEVHIFDFDQSIYAQVIEVVFRHRIRSEKKFTQLPQLVAQIQQDAREARQYLGI